MWIPLENLRGERQYHFVPTRGTQLYEAKLNHFPLLLIVIFLSRKKKMFAFGVYIAYNVELNTSQCLSLAFSLFFFFFFPPLATYPVEIVFTLIERSREQLLCLHDHLISFLEHCHHRIFFILFLPGPRFEA